MSTPNSNAAKQLLSLLNTSKSNLHTAPSSPEQIPATPPAEPAAGTQQVTASESETTCSGLLAGQNKKKCAATNKKGNPCGAYPSLGSDLCPFHHPEYAERMQESRVEGGRRRAIYQAPDIIESNFASVRLGLESPLGLQGAIEAIMRLVLLGRIPPRHAGILMRYLNGAIRNFPNINKTPGIRKREDFHQVIHDICLYSGLIERDLDEQALRERIDKITDTGAHRHEILKANEAFGFGAKSEPRTSVSGRVGNAWEMPYGSPPAREPYDPIAAWGLPPGTGEGGRLSMEDLFPNGAPWNQPHSDAPASGPRESEPRT